MDPQTARQMCEMPSPFPRLFLFNFADIFLEIIVVIKSLWLKCNSKTIKYNKPTNALW